MTEQSGPRGGDAAFRQQREEIAQRNADSHRRGQEERKAKERAVEVRGRVQAAREADELDQLNAQIAKRRGGGG